MGLVWYTLLCCTSPGFQDDLGLWLNMHCFVAHFQSVRWSGTDSNECGSIRTALLHIFRVFMMVQNRCIQRQINTSKPPRSIAKWTEKGVKGISLSHLYFLLMSAIFRGPYFRRYTDSSYRSLRNWCITGTMHICVKGWILTKWSPQRVLFNKECLAALENG